EAPSEMVLARRPVSAPSSCGVRDGWPATSHMAAAIASNRPTAMNRCHRLSPAGGSATAGTGRPGAATAGAGGADAGAAGSAAGAAGAAVNVASAAGVVKDDPEKSAGGCAGTGLTGAAAASGA